MSRPRNEDPTEHSVSPAASNLSRARKRIRTACGPCRSRKQSCNGHHPCSRCSADGRECYYGEKERKTPLTRQRMTQLEERIAQYEELWKCLFAGYALNAAVSDYKRDGSGAVLSKLKETCALDRAQHHTQSSEPDHHGDLTQTFEPHGHDNHHTFEPPSEPETRAYFHDDTLPPTRRVSRDATPGDPDVFEWCEASDPDGDGDAGMASLIHGRGTTFFGLSSGAAFLNVIRKLVPATVQGFTPVHAAVTAPPGARPQDTADTHRYLVIPPYSLVKPYIEAYFTYFHQLTPLVHEPTIRAQVTGALAIQDKPGNAVLFNMMFARGALDIGTSDGDTYYLLARDALKRDMLHGGTLELVQGLGMMANYLQQSGRPNAGYMALGWAIRMAMALGLHTPSGACTPLERETRLRVWWAIVTMEAGCCATFGRPHAAGAFQLHTTPLPINCDDEHLTVVSDTAPTSVNRPTLYTALGYQSRLAQATCAILDRILHSNPAPTLAQLRRYDGRILVAIRDMPEYMCALPGAGPHQLALNVQRWRTRDLRAILYRPLLLGVAWRSGSPTTVCPEVLEAIDTCRTLASENLHDILIFVQTTNDYMRGSEWYTVFFAFQSCLTLLLSVVAEPLHPSATEWRQILQSTADWFRKVHSMATLGNSYAQVVEGVLSSVHSPNSAEAAGLAGMQSLLGAGTLPDASLDMDQFWQEIWGLASGEEMALFAVDDSSALPFSF